MLVKSDLSVCVGDFDLAVQMQSTDMQQELLQVSNACLGIDLETSIINFLMCIGRNTQIHEL